MTKHVATLIPGDGIGPEVVGATTKVLSALGAPFSFDVRHAGMHAWEKTGDALPEEVLGSIRHTKLVLKGPLGTPSGGGYRSATVRLRETFQLFANVRPSSSFVPGFREGVDLVLVRENLQGLYASSEGYIPVGDDSHGVAFATAYNSKEEMRRIVRYACDLAVSQNRLGVTVVHKSNILKALSGILVEAAKEVAEDFKDSLQMSFEIADAFGANLVHRPQTYDVIVTTNLFGDLFSDISARLVGSLGTAPGANIGTEAAMFEAVHGTADDIAGKGVANPTSLLLSAVMMLDHVGENDTARKLEAVVKDTIRSGAMTKDIGGQLGTDEFAAAVISRL